ncbi:Integrase catalytic core protein [Phytophthora palmivora]|uniref:Integrase catalytic core protein n=1 Tax=Phytophthora palmivora TaxID=4796 RepID=A0A2P4YC51_9STRA|nr:Integrase catalytic core protein [Phytophthora palmivora]
MNSICVVPAVCVAFDYIVEQPDADTAFLNSGLSDIVYMEVPDGVKNAKGMVCKLLKDIWAETGSKRSEQDYSPSVSAERFQELWGSYVKRTKNVTEFSEVKDALNNAFKVKELGTTKFILGMEIDHDRNASTLMIKLTRYIDDVAERFGQKDAKPVDNPCSSNLKLSKAQSPGTVKERTEMQ